jgi:hypothetical protein
VFEFRKHNGSDTTLTRQYKGLHRALRCEVHGGSSKLRAPVDFPVFRRVIVGPHKFTAAATILKHLYTQLMLQAKLEQLKLSKTNPSMWL